MIFDDSHPHEVWNDCDSYRVVLFVDFERPLFPLSRCLTDWRSGALPDPLKHRATNRSGAGLCPRVREMMASK